MKIPILKAFENMFQLSLRKKGMSALEISRTFDVNKDTAALLKRKIQYGCLAVEITNLKARLCE
jgi:orotate phosphoribosyltransferase-like protein